MEDQAERGGPGPRARGLASLGALTATTLRPLARKGNGRAETADDRAAQQVLAAHQAAARPDWRK